MIDQQQKKDSFVLNVMVTAIGVLISKGVKQAAAVRIGKEIGDALCERYGGCQYYLPNHYTENAAAVAAEMYCDFDGRNYNELAEKYNLSLRRVHRLLSQTDKAKAVRPPKHRKRGGGTPTNQEASLILKSRLTEMG